MTSILAKSMYLNEKRKLLARCAVNLVPIRGFEIRVQGRGFIKRQRVVFIGHRDAVNWFQVSHHELFVGVVANRA